MLFSCEEDTQSKRERAEKRYKEAIQFRQGSLGFQNGIAEAIAIDSTYEEAVYELSVAHLKRGMPHKWLPQYEKALALNPEHRYPWRGYLYLWFYRDYKKAIADFDMSDSLTPNFTDAPQGHSVDYWRGIAYLGLKDYENSIAYFDKHIQKETEETGEDWVEHEAFLYRGIAHYENGNPAKALENFNTLLKYNADFADAKYYKALLLYEQLNKLFVLIETSQNDNLEEEFQRKKSEALVLINKAIDNFHNGYSNQRPYVETLRQLYWQDYTNLKTQLEAF